MPKRFGDLILHVVVAIGFMASVFPVYWMFVASTQSNQQIFSDHPRFWPGSSLFHNYQDLMTNSGINIYIAIGNSLFVSLTSTIIAVLLACLAGYSFAVFRSRQSDFLFQILLFAIMVPPQVTLIPLFRMMSDWNLIDTYGAVILPSIVSVFGVFLMRQSFLSFPIELLDAARIDGLSEFQTFWRIVLPLMRPTLSSLSILTFLGSWTNLLWPLVVLNDAGKYTVPLALSTLTSTQTQPNYGMIMLGATLGTIPLLIVFLLLRRNFVSGIMAGYNR